MGHYVACCVCVRVEQYQCHLSTTPGEVLWGQVFSIAFPDYECEEVYGDGATSVEVDGHDISYGTPPPIPPLAANQASIASKAASPQSNDDAAEGGGWSRQTKKARLAAGMKPAVTA